MFFEESKINDNLNCEKCKHRLNEPRMLPCGKTICTECTSTLQINENRFKCILCEKIHFTDDDGLPLNHLIYNFLLQNPVDVSRGISGDKLKIILQKIEDDVNLISNRLYNPIDYIKEYCMDIENEMQLAKEEHLLVIEEYHQELSKKIAEFKTKYLTRIELQKLDEKENFENLLKEMKYFIDRWSSYLRNTNFDDKLLCEAIESGKMLIEKSERQLSILDNLIFDDSQILFHKSNRISMDTVIGSVKKRMLACLLTVKQEKDLFKLCNLNPDDNWTLIYQATRDGFSANDFHSKCDSRKNTLIVVKSKNGNVFGGYTQHDWSDNGYKNDPNAFIFSLLNKDNKPICIKTFKPEFAIYCDPTCGPTFGGGIDFFICANSNTINSSYSNLNHSYLNSNNHNGSNEAKSFLSGSYNFLTLDILVFSKIP